MTADQETQLLGGIAALCRALGADRKPEEPPQKQTLYGLAYAMGRLLKTPELCRVVAGLACAEYLPDAAPPKPPPS
jgi:hypothetical protein